MPNPIWIVVALGVASLYSFAVLPKSWRTVVNAAMGSIAFVAAGLAIGLIASDRSAAQILKLEDILQGQMSISIGYGGILGSSILAVQLLFHRAKFPIKA